MLDEWLLSGIFGGVAIALWTGIWFDGPLSVLARVAPLLITPHFPIINMLVRHSKAQQLYALLRRLDGPSEPVGERAEAEVS